MAAVPPAAQAVAGAVNRPRKRPNLPPTARSGGPTAPNIPPRRSRPLAPPSQPEPTAKNLADLQPNPRNPRKPWSPEQADAFRRSLREFGDLSGIVLNLTTKQLVGGHKRVEVFREATAPSIVKTDQPEDAQGTVAHGYVIVDDSRFAYREVRWPASKEALANLAANQWGAEWDWQAVSTILQEIGPADLTLTGFNAHELDPLLAADWTPPAPTEDVESDHHTHTLHLTTEQHGVFVQAKAKIGDDISDGRAVELLAADYLSGA